MLTQRIERFLKTNHVPPGASLLIGYSGGPDSTCLVSLMHALGTRLGYRLACAYLDHGIRPAYERLAEAAQVKNFCESLGLPLFTRELEAGSLEGEARRSKVSLEAAARAARRAFFSELRKQHDFAYLLLGHTLDDQLETVLWRIFQGSGSGGIRGIRARNGWILRPLLGTARREIIAYLREANLSFSSDSTNQGNRFLRNRIRHSLIPVLQGIFPGMGRSLASLSAKMAAMDSYLQKQAEVAFIWEKTENGVKTEAEVFFQAPAALRLYALYREGGKLRTGAGPLGRRALPYRFLAPLLSRSAGRSKNILLRGRGIVIRREGTRLFLERDIVADKKKGYFINVSPGVPFAFLERQFVLLPPGEGKKQTDKLLCAFQAQKVDCPFIMRSRRPGDRIDLGFGSKRLKKLFNEWRAAKMEKDVIPVLEDGKGILAVLGQLRGFKNIFRSAAEAKDNAGQNGQAAFILYERIARE
jgi:tRNA(Ile)-lysidine synthetase-like protein